MNVTNIAHKAVKFPGNLANQYSWLYVSGETKLLNSNTAVLTAKKSN